MKKYELQLEELNQRLASYNLKIMLGMKRSITIKEQEAYDKYNKFKTLVENTEIPKWFDGRCHSIPYLEEYVAQLNEWENKILERACDKGIFFDNVSKADEFLRVARAKKYLKEAKEEYMNLLPNRHFRRVELKKIIEKLIWSIKSKKGVARNGVNIISKQVIEEEKKTSESINWNGVIKVPRVS